VDEFINGLNMKFSANSDICFQQV